MDNQNWTFEEPTPETEVKPEPPKGTAIKSMIFGILSIELAAIPVIGIVGLIFAILARKWAYPIIQDYPNTGARMFAKAGYITGGVGRGLFIGFTIFWVCYALLLGGMMMLGGM